MTAPNDTNTIDREAVATKLDEARALIERGWTQHQYARGKGRRRARPNGKAATCFCALGALHKAYGIDDYDSSPAAAVLRQVVGPIPQWNDDPERTQTDVVEAFERAAAGVRSGEIAL